MRYRYRVAALLFLLAVITYLDRVCISVAGPRIQEYLRIGPQQWGWVVGAFALAYAVFEIPGGWMADRFGPRVILTRIVLWWSAFTALTGAVYSYPVLLLTRFWFGRAKQGRFLMQQPASLLGSRSVSEDEPLAFFRWPCRSEVH